MNARASSLAAALLFVAAVGAKAQPWTELGPAPIDSGTATFQGATGRVAGIAPSPLRPNRYFLAAASGGVWWTNNAGATWRPLGDALPTTAMGAIAVDPRDDRVLYAGSGEANGSYHSLYGLGLYKSTDRGQTWEALGIAEFSGRSVAHIAISPAAPDRLLVAAGRAGGSFAGNEGAREHPRRRGTTGIFGSDDGGRTWFRPTGLPRRDASDVRFDPRDPRRVWAAFGSAYGDPGNGIYRSLDGGRSWSRLALGAPGDAIGRPRIGVSPSNPNRLYVLSATSSTRATTGGFFPGSNGVLGLFRSDDGGDTWRRTDPGNFMRGQGNYNVAVVVHPTNPNQVFLGGVQMLRSDDGGSTFIDVTPPHVDIHDIVFDGAGRLVVACDGGIYRSTNLGATWLARNQDLGVVQYYAGLSVAPDDRSQILLGAQDNGTHLRLGNQWFEIFGGDGGYTAIHPTQTNIRLVQFQGVGNLFRSVDGGFTWVQSLGIAAGDRTAFQAPLARDPTNPERVLYATQRVWESLDGGQNFNPLSGDLVGAPWAIRDLAIAPSNALVVHALTNNGRLLTSRDGGRTFTQGRTGVGGWPRITRQIAFDPLEHSLAWVADMRFGGTGVLATRDAGRTWQAVARDLPDVPVNTVAVHRDGSDRFVLAGTDTGVFVSTDNGRRWRPYGSRLPNVPVQDLVVDTAHARLVASTLGRGVWTNALPDGTTPPGDPGDPGDPGNPGECTETLGTGRYCTACGPCTAGQGDCDTNAECAAGLSCAQNVGAQFGFAPGVDVCVAGNDPGNPNPPPGGCTETLGNGRYCTACGPCAAGQGDCDNDTECAGSLVCAQNVGAQFGFAPGVDVCVADGGPGNPDPPGGCTETLGNGRYCTACGPCAAGQGDCDNDAECAAGLSCLENVGAQFGFAPGVDVCG